MAMDPNAARALELVERLGRLAAGESWGEGLNPTQMAALSFLARANQFSRRPGAVAAYLAATKGTVSQTLQALERKGLATRVASQTDGRSARYDATPDGLEALSRSEAALAAFKSLGEQDAAQLVRLLESVLREALEARGGRAFGVCRTCRHFQRTGQQARCGLLQVDLAPEETLKICIEHQPSDLGGEAAV